MKFLMIVLFLLGRGEVGRASEKRTVVASFSILGDFLREICPPELSVEVIVAPDEDSHHYELTAKERAFLAKAPAIFAVGAGFEPWLGKTGAKSIELGRELPLQEFADKHFAKAGQKDPHFWQNPKLAAEAVVLMARELSQTFPEYSKVIAKKRDAFLGDLKKLDADLKEAFALLPKDRRLIITSHDAFGYFGQAYDLKFLSPQGWSTDSEPSARDVATIIRQIREAKVRALFMENLTQKQTIDRISQETGVKIGGTLYADSLSGAQGPASTYIKMMRANAAVILKALE